MKVYLYSIKQPPTASIEGIILDGDYCISKLTHENDFWSFWKKEQSNKSFGRFWYGISDFDLGDISNIETILKKYGYEYKISYWPEYFDQMKSKIGITFSAESQLRLKLEDVQNRLIILT